MLTSCALFASLPLYTCHDAVFMLVRDMYLGFRWTKIASTSLSARYKSGQGTELYEETSEGQKWAGLYDKLYAEKSDGHSERISIGKGQGSPGLGLHAKAGRYTSLLAT